MNATLTDHQKSIFFDYAAADGKITKRDVERYGKQVERDIAEVGAQLARLKVGATTAGAENGNGKPRREAKPAKTPITPKQLASRKLQGRYLALVRQFSESKRKKFAKIASGEGGRKAAIAAMKEELKEKA